MNDWNTVSKFVNFTIKGITPSYVKNSSVIVLNQKCIRNNKIDYTFSKFTDDIKNISSEKFIKKGDILVNSTGTGTAGRCAFVSEIPKNYKLIVDSHILILRCNSFYEAQCINYVLYSFEKKLMSFLTGSSGQSELDKVVLLGLKTKMTDSSEDQQKIASVLSALDSKIELNNKINAELEQMAKTLYDYWFVQFDFPDENGKPYKSSGGKMVWNEKIKREIPDGWEVKKISDLLPVLTGKQDANFAKQNGKYNFFTCGEEILKCDSYEFDGKAILVAGNGNFNIKLYEGKFNAYQRTYVLIPKNEKYYTLIYMAVRDRIDSFIKGSRGSIVKFITKGDIEDIQIPLPKDESLDLFSSLNTIIQKIEKNLEENQELTKLRDWLLPMLMNGQVTVN